MYSLLLVDDEPAILNGLYQNVDWDDLGIDKVYRAGLAADALEIIRRHHIDLVITDIRMPEMDGVQLAEAIRKSWPYTMIIFLTGHQDFDYAQTAVDLGVFRYMLKPILYDDIKAVAGEAIEVLSRSLADSSHLKDMEEKLVRLRPVLRERYISRWLERGDTGLLENTGELQEYGLSLTPADWGFLLVVKPDTPVRGMQETNLLHLSIRDLAAEILFTDCRMLDYCNVNNHSVLLFLQAGAAEALLMQRRIVERLEAYQFALSEGLAQSFTLFWTEQVPLLHIHETYASLKGRMDRHITLLRSGMIGPDSQGSPHTAAELKSLIQQPSLAAIIGSLRKGAAQERLDMILSELAEWGDNEVLIMQVYHEITGTLVTDSLHRGFTLQQWGEEYMEYFKSMAAVPTLAEFCRVSREVVECYIDYAIGSSLSQSGNLIAQIQAAVRENLGRDITVSSLAEQFSYHPNYLSRLFNQETKLSLQEFIISERVTAAKLLLSDGVKVGEVSRQVGYESIAHFSRIFKKVTGQTPKQYQLEH
ncbi:MAG: response regulator [Oscillospiraceae bacterium]